VPRVVIGLPAYENAEFLPEALESLLGQTYPDFAVVVCDDSASEEPGRVVERFARRDPRIHYERNSDRLGMIDNWRRTYERARELHPDAEFFAWGSDHDAWHPRWLERLVPLLDGDPEVVLAYPMNIRIGADGAPLVTPWRFDTQGIADVGERMSVAARGMYAGDMVYGLFRAEAQGRAGVFRHVLLPDRLLLSEMSIHGQFAQVPEILWFRRFTGIASLKRQRAAFFPEGAPAYSYLPWWLVHPAVLAYELVLRGAGRPGIGRLAGASLAGQFVAVNLRLEGLRKVQRAHAKLRTRFAPARRVAGAAISFGARRGWRGPVAIQRAHHFVVEQGGVAALVRRRRLAHPDRAAPPQ
jgi:glycosyltransferase involved in cell wall biosynthesis